MLLQYVHEKIFNSLFCPGSYQDNLNQDTCKTCPASKYCDPYELFNLTGIIVPMDCPPGYYCPASTEFDTQNPCPPGTFSNQTALTASGMYF